MIEEQKGELVNMSWKNELRKAPFGRFKRNKTPKMTPNQQEKANGVITHMTEIVRAFENDPEYQRVGKFAIKVVPENFTGRGRKRGLVWDMQEEIFGDINFVKTHAIPELKRKGFAVTEMGDILEVQKMDDIDQLYMPSDF